MPTRTESSSPHPPLGAIVGPDGVTFTVWAPAQREVALVLEDGDDIPMHHRPGGYFTVTIGDARPGQRYSYRIAEGLRADPASRFQPDGPFGPSQIVDPHAYTWRATAWRGAPPRHRQVVYELHLGTFTTGGTWASARARLSRLASLGVTTLEVMPIAEFDGRFGWGYDGVLLFAPFHGYGTPDDARAFVDAAHAAGLSVILDVVYNHLGPAGNYLPEFSASYFSDHETEWGRGFNLDGDCSAPVRHFMRENVRHWIQEYRFDGLRFDATQSLVDRSPVHIVHELSEHARAAAAPRPVYLTAENEPQDVFFVRRREGDPGVDTLWNEDWHHAAVVALTGRREAYFTDYLGTAPEFAAMARWNLLYQGQWYSWQKQTRGTDSRGYPQAAFTCFLENHDQVANTGRGRRLHQSVDRGKWRALSTLLLLGPSTPFMFQGQEEAVEQPFVYFADHQQPLSGLVKNGRLEFLSQFPSLTADETRAELPDPGDEALFRACQLRWIQTTAGREARALYTDLLTLRHTDPVLAALGTTDVTVDASAPDSTLILLRYTAGDNGRLLLINLGRLTLCPMNDPLFAAAAGQQWEMLFCSERSQYGGLGVDEFFDDGCWRLQSHCAWLFHMVPAAASRGSQRDR